MEFEGQVVSCTKRKTERGGRERSKLIKTFGGVALVIEDLARGLKTLDFPGSKELE